MTRTSPITGASSGPGAEYARHHARRGDRLVLVARAQARLEALAHDHGPSGTAGVTMPPADLATPQRIDTAAIRLRDSARPGLARGEEGIPNRMWLEATRVVDESLRDAARGKAVSVPS